MQTAIHKIIIFIVTLGLIAGDFPFYGSAAYSGPQSPSESSSESERFQSVKNVQDLDSFIPAVNSVPSGSISNDSPLSNLNSQRNSNAPGPNNTNNQYNQNNNSNQNQNGMQITKEAYSDEQGYKGEKVTVTYQGAIYGIYISATLKEKKTVNDPIKRLIEEKSGNLSIIKLSGKEYGFRTKKIETYDDGSDENVEYEKIEEEYYVIGYKGELLTDRSWTLSHKINWREIESSGSDMPVKTILKTKSIHEDMTALIKEGKIEGYYGNKSDGTLSDLGIELLPYGETIQDYINENSLSHYNEDSTVEAYSGQLTPSRVRETTTKWKVQEGKNLSYFDKETVTSYQFDSKGKVTKTTVDIKQIEKLAVFTTDTHCINVNDKITYSKIENGIGVKYFHRETKYRDDGKNSTSLNGTFAAILIRYGVDEKNYKEVALFLEPDGSGSLWVNGFSANFETMGSVIMKVQKLFSSIFKWLQEAGWEDSGGGYPLLPPLFW